MTEPTTITDLERRSRAYALLADRSSQPDGSEWDHDRLRRLVDDLMRAIR